jgi:bla regulator protein blaR1
MTDWLLDTLLWTGVLLALVLLLRRPVARHFGAQAAYALWALPFLRLLTPGITLPAWMNPAPEPASAPVAEAVTVSLSAAGAPVAAAVSSPAAGLPIDWLALGLAAWLVGAFVFLVFRFRAYFEMRCSPMPAKWAASAAAC